MAMHVDNTELLYAEIRGLLDKTFEELAPEDTRPSNDTIDEAARNLVAAWAQITNAVRIDEEPDSASAIPQLDTVIEDWSEPKAQLIIGRSAIIADAAARDLFFEIVANTAADYARDATADAFAGFPVNLVISVGKAFISAWGKAYKLKPKQICIAHSARQASKQRENGLTRFRYVTIEEVLENIPSLEQTLCASDEQTEKVHICQKAEAALWDCPYLETSRQPYLICALRNSKDEAKRVRKVMQKLAKKGIFHKKKREVIGHKEKIICYKYRI